MIMPTVPKITKMLGGHTSPETAYIDDDYPFGFHLRCKIRFWTEFGTRGHNKHEQRFCSQTTNPKRSNEFDGSENSPKCGIFWPMVLMYLDHEEHVQQLAMSVTTPPAVFLAIDPHVAGLSDAERTRYTKLREASAKYYPETWTAWTMYLAQQPVPESEELASAI